VESISWITAMGRPDSNLDLPTTNNENAIMPFPEGQWAARPGTVDGPIGRFLLPLGGALLRLPGSFVFYKKNLKDAPKNNFNST